MEIASFGVNIILFASFLQNLNKTSCQDQHCEEDRPSILQGETYDDYKRLTKFL